MLCKSKPEKRSICPESPAKPKVETMALIKWRRPARKSSRQMLIAADFIHVALLSVDEDATIKFNHRWAIELANWHRSAVPFWFSLSILSLTFNFISRLVLRKIICVLMSKLFCHYGRQTKGSIIAGSQRSPDNGAFKRSWSHNTLGKRLTGIFAAGKTPIWLAPVRRLSARLLLPSTLPNDSGKPNSSPTLKPWRCGARREGKRKWKSGDRELLSRVIRKIGLNWEPARCIIWDSRDINCVIKAIWIAEKIYKKSRKSLSHLGN